jgi:hypothetical protein
VSCEDHVIRIRDQCSRGADASGGGRDVVLMELITLQHVESDGCASLSDDAHVGEMRLQPLAKTFERARASQSLRHESGVRIAVAIVPDARERGDFGCVGIANAHVRRRQRLPCQL